LHWANPFHGLMLIYVSRMIDGISGGNISAAQAYVSDVTASQNRAKGMGVLGAAFGCGFTLGPAAGALLVLKNAALPGYFAALMSLVAMTMTIVRLPESRIHKPADAGNWLHPRRFAPIFKSPRLVQLLMIVFVSMFAFAMLETIAAQFVSSKDILGFKDWQVGMYYAYLGVIIVAVQGGLIGRLTKRFGEWPLAIIGPLVISVGMLGYVGTSITPTLWLVLLAGAFNAIGRSLQTPTMFALISQNSDPRHQGVVFGLNQGLGGIARVLGPLAAERAFSYRLAGPYALAAVLMIIAGIWTLLLRGSIRLSHKPD